MKSANVVIGANFGDEGKGRFTDHFAKPGGLVVRYNGGSQAGHTVYDDSGRRHVFGHFGAGTFKRAHTYLSDQFIVNPWLWEKELRKLNDLGVNPVLMVDHGAPLTTPYDMILNQAVESKRGGTRHGSCGVGINETITRNEVEEFRTCVRDTTHEARLRRKLKAIRHEWVPYRMEQLGLTDKPEYVDNVNVSDNFIAACENFWTNVIFTDLRVLWAYKDIVFEGAQGLLLDEQHHWFPHVTRSRTGLTNVLRIAELAEIDMLEVTYVTRPYLTRHGNGPLPNELTEKPYDIVDPTNVTNDWQGSLRFAYLHLDLLADSIFDDLAQANGKKTQIVYDLGITCLDQIKGEIFFWHDKKLKREATALDILRPIYEECRIDTGFVSTGPQGPIRTVQVKDEIELVA